MKKSCWSCKHCLDDYQSTGTLDCLNFDNMTEEEIMEYYTNNGGENCPYYQPSITEEEIKAEAKALENLLSD